MHLASETTHIIAPVRLNAETRGELRTAVDERLATTGGDSSPLVIDLAATREIDAAGIGALVVVQQQARSRGRATWLVETGPHVRSLLGRTRLDAWFEFKRRTELGDG